MNDNEAGKPGDVVKVYELDGKWYEEVRVDSKNTISRPVTPQGIAEATAAAEHAVYAVLEATQPAPTEAPPAEADPEAETPPESLEDGTEDSVDDPDGDADAPRVPKRRGRPPKVR